MKNCEKNERYVNTGDMSIILTADGKYRVVEKQSYQEAWMCQK